MISYKDSGVDVEAGYEAVRLMKEHVNKTFRPEVMTGLGGFGGAFSLDLSKFENPVLVSGTDGVGTKLKIAFLLDKCDTVGIDCVAMCVNDIVCSGAEPLFFLDYIAVGKNIPTKVATIVKGVAEGCLQSGCSLTGGETAEMPGFYSIDEFDIAGFAVGAVSKNKIINGNSICPGDVLVGLPSSGVHSNGFSLVRKILNPTKERLGEYVNSLGCTVGEELIKPTRIYVKTVLDLISKYTIKGISHITGGGFFENIPRMGDDKLCYVINKGSWPILPIFPLLQQAGGVPEENMFNTFNMGIGMVFAMSPAEAKSVVDYLALKGEKAYIIGKVTDKLPDDEAAMIKGNLAII